MNRLLFFILIASPSFGQAPLVLEDKIYDPYIKTVQLYPLGIKSNAQLLSAAIPLRGNQQLVLTFDELYNDDFSYLAKYIRCDANWQESTLLSLEFLTTYNEFIIDNYEFSFNTKIPYVHYKIVLPKPILSGNYVVVVYADGDEEDIILTKRFIVYENKVAFTNQRGFNGMGQPSRFNQQLEFELNYKGVNVQNPIDQISVSIIQNQRWDIMRSNIKPTFIRELEYILAYQNFSEELRFPGGNEFRFFDMRSIRYFGENVKTVHIEKEQNYAWIEDDKPKSEFVHFTALMDLNGGFVIDNVEGFNPLIENDYAKVEFTLVSPKINKNIYIVGALNAWERSKDNILTYNDELGAYKGSLILKQGWYNYQYLVESPSHSYNYFEGDWSATQNQYQLIVYYRPFDLATDLIIGYLDLVPR